MLVFLDFWKLLILDDLIFYFKINMFLYLFRKVK